MSTCCLRVILPRCLAHEHPCGPSKVSVRPVLALFGGAGGHLLARWSAAAGKAEPWAGRARQSRTVHSMAGPKALVIAGPSGVGKGTLIEMLKQEFPDSFGFSVSHTTRQPREGEVDGVHYHFVSADKMAADILLHRFLEHAQVHGNFYGTSVAAVEAVKQTGKICILDIDVQGCRQCRKVDLPGHYVFISPPSFEELERRLRGRGTETEDKILKRLKNAKGELDARNEAGLFDHQVRLLPPCARSRMLLRPPALRGPASAARRRPLRRHGCCGVGCAWRPGRAIGAQR